MQTAHNSAGERSTQQLVESLTRAAGVVGGAVTKERQRKQYLHGKTLAQSEAGRAEIDEKMGGMLNQVFGPDAEMRGAQEQIVQTSVTGQVQAARKYIDDQAGMISESDWRGFVDGMHDKLLENYEDEGLRDIITMALADEIPLLDSKYYANNKAFAAEANYRAGLDSIIAETSLASSEIASGGPQNLESAAKRIDSAILHKATGESVAARSRKLTEATLNSLNNDSDLFYKRLVELGEFEKLTQREQAQIKVAVAAREQRTDVELAEYMYGMSRMVADGDFDGHEAAYQALLHTNPESAAQYDVAKARQNALVQQGMEQARREREQRAVRVVADGSTALTGLSPAEVTKAVTSHTGTLLAADYQKMVQASQERDGTPAGMGSDVQPTQAELLDFAMTEGNDTVINTLVKNRGVKDSMYLQYAWNIVAGAAVDTERLASSPEYKERLRTATTFLTRAQQALPSRYRVGRPISDVDVLKASVDSQYMGTTLQNELEQTEASE